MSAPFAHVYLHVPFGRTRSPASAARPVPGGPADLADWVEILAGERALRSRAEAGAALDEPLASLLVGGGVPSLLGPGLASGVRRSLGERALVGVGEWSIEASPADVTPGLAREWVQEGVSRAVVRVRSLQESALRWLGMLHRPEDGLGALERFRSAGVRSLAAELVFGLPEPVDPEPEASLEGVLAAGVDHVSLYELDPEPHSALERAVGAGTITLPSDDRKAEIWLRLTDRLIGAGFVGCDPVHWARPGHDSVHGRAIRLRHPVLGLGPGARTFRNPRRRWNVTEWEPYAGAVREGRDPLGGTEVLSAPERRLERVWSRLASRDGLREMGLDDEDRGTVAGWVHSGWAAIDGGRVRLTREGWLRLDGLAGALVTRGTDRARSVSGPGSVLPTSTDEL